MGSANFAVDIYGYKARIHSSSEDVLDNLRQDFAFFQANPSGEIFTIELFRQAPSFESLPALNATVYTPRNVSYRQGSVTYVDYSGQALGIHNKAQRSFRLFSDNPDLLYEASYLFLLSRSGEALDANGFHRVHALGVAVGGKAALVLLPMGGGKSVLGSHLLAHPDVRLLSDDSPVIDAHGTVHAFPLRLGLLPGSETGIPQSQLRRINRMEFGPKLLVNYPFFTDRVCARAEPGFFFIGSRNSGTQCIISPASLMDCYKAVLANCVIGLGLFQGMEFVFNSAPADLRKKPGILMRRLRAARQLLNRSRKYRITLGRDLQQNAKVLHDFLAGAG